MTSDFYLHYYNAAKDFKLSTAFYFNNPTKFMACDALKRLHEARGDKIIIFYLVLLRIYTFPQAGAN